ncbi:TPA: hypothetical protein LR177_000124 [Enterobacter cloacae]|nr:hypothetical protein [Enterobacter cloacae]
MNRKFCGFYTPKQENYKEIWNDKNTLFIFDTNTLLNLYRCEEQTKDDILNVMNVLSPRSWFPFQVCLEYQRNRIDVISQSIKSLEKLKKSITSMVNTTDNALSEAQVKKHLYSSLSEEVSLLKESLSASINSFVTDKIEPRIKTKEKIKTSDAIRKSLDDIIGDNCGDIPSQEIIDEINKEGAERYAKKTPPGFMDEKKGETVTHYNGVEFKDKFGDLYLWKEILDISKKHENYNIIFVTDDSKKDWWFSHDNKTIGPSEPLQTEIYFTTKIKSFRMINHSGFLYEAGKYLDNLQIKPSSVEDIKEISSDTLRKLSELDYKTHVRRVFKTSPTQRILVRKGKEIEALKQYYIPFHYKKDDVDNIITAYDHFRSKYDELQTQCIELSEMIEFNYDIGLDNEEVYNLRLAYLNDIKIRLLNLSESLLLIEEKLNNSDLSENRESLDISLSNISAETIKIRKSILDLSEQLL